MKKPFRKSENTIIKKNHVVDNENMNLLSATAINIGGTSFIFDGLEIDGLVNDVIYLFSEAETPHVDKDKEIIFKDKNNPNNKIYLSINRRIYIDDKNC